MLLQEEWFRICKDSECTSMAQRDYFKLKHLSKHQLQNKPYRNFFCRFNPVELAVKKSTL